MERYKDLVFSIPLRYGAPQQDAADIFQAVWFDLFNELPRLRRCRGAAKLARARHGQ